MSRSKPLSVRVRQYRSRMRALGLRQINLWVPDTRSPAFAREARRQSLLAAESDRRSDIPDFLDAAYRDLDNRT